MGRENDLQSEGEGLVRLEILVEADTMREIEEVVQERGWELAEGVRLLLGSGLAYVKGERVLQAVESGAMSQDDLQRMLSRMVETETRLAALRFRTWEAQQANQAWELSTGAIRNELPRTHQSGWARADPVLDKSARMYIISVQFTLKAISSFS